MAILKRLSLIFQAKANKALDRAEDPREVLDLSYEKQLELLAKVRRGVVDVATSRKRIELQAQQVTAQAATLQQQAQAAMAAGREDLAREALTRKEALRGQLADLQAQHQQLADQEQKLVVSANRLQAKVDAFRTRKETVKATYTAAEAQTRIGEAFAGVSEEMSDLTAAMQRAEDKAAQMQARAGALDELLAVGALPDAASGPGADIQAELDRIGAADTVERELAQLRATAGAGPAPVEAGPDRTAIADKEHPK